MSLKDKASLIFKPSRYKSGKAYSFRGSDVTVSRSSVGTRINEEGKIEEVAANVPRLNYDPADLTKCPVLLTEKDSTNIIPYSVAIDAWSKSGSGTGSSPVVTSGFKDPSGGNDGCKVVFDSGSGTTSSDESNLYLSLSGVAAGDYTMSFWAKSDGIYDKILVRHVGGYLYTTIELTNEWKRYEVTENLSSTGPAYPSFTLRRGLANEPINSHVECYIWGVQLEANTKASSFIKTTGSTATRADETVTASSPISGARGSFYFNLSQMNTIGYGTSVPTIALYKTNTTTGAIGLLDNNVTQGEMRAFARLNGTLYYYNTHFSAPNGVKMCFVWDSNDSDTKVYKNGVLWGTISQSFTQTLSDGLVLNGSTRENFLEYEEVLVYNERLSEAEAIALTSYDDYQELVDRNDLTWESSTITNNRLTALQEL